MVKILRQPEKKNNVVVIGNKKSDSVISTRIPYYMGLYANYERQKQITFVEIKTGGK